jgi:hypothetical protein
MPEQFIGVGGYARRERECARILGRNTVDHGKARFHRRAVTRVDAAGDRRGEDDAGFLLQTDKGLAPGRIVGRQVMAGDGDEASAFSEARER